MTPQISGVKMNFLGYEKFPQKVFDSASVQFSGQNIDILFLNKSAIIDTMYCGKNIAFIILTNLVILVDLVILVKLLILVIIYYNFVRT